jgi:hypothetical protein
MASSPAKRRKLSPEPSAPTDAPTTPSRIPGPRDGTRTTPVRPSFASPTKASISRHNPQLLSKAPVTGTGSGRPEDGGTSKTSKPESLFVTQSTQNEGPSNAPVSAVAESSATVNAPVPVPAPAPEPIPAVATPSAEVSQPKKRGRRSTKGRLSSVSQRKTRKSTEAGQEAAKQAEAPDNQQTEVPKEMDPLDPFKKAGLRRSPVPSQNEKTQPPERPQVSQPADLFSSVQTAKPMQPAQISQPPRNEEPELPPTPTQRGLEDPTVTTPPTGIHNTPSKRTKRTRGAKYKGSPLKPQPLPPPESEAENERSAKRRKEENAQRHLVPIDPHAEKKRRRSRLLLEVQQLEADIALAEQENERIRKYYRSGRRDPPEAPNSEEILKLLVRSTARPEFVDPPPKPKTIFQSIAAFLPFSKKPHPPPAASLKADVPSHLPQKLDDPLPHLQLFTPLTFTSTITLLPLTPGADPSSTSTDILQTHSISANAPSGLFYSRVNMTVNTSTLTVNRVDIDRVDPNAEAELGPWIRQRALGNSVLGRDINAIYWAMSQWFEIAIKRAKFWCTLEAELGNEGARAKSNLKIREASRRKKRKEGGPLDIGPVEEIYDQSELRKIWTRRQLLLQMKRTAMTIGSGSVELTIEWRIAFDWTGEAEQCISASARLPATCKPKQHSLQETILTRYLGEEHDERGSLAKVPLTFAELVRERGPMFAARAMVALLMP